MMGDAERRDYQQYKPQYMPPPAQADQLQQQYPYYNMLHHPNLQFNAHEYQHAGYYQHHSVNHNENRDHHHTTSDPNAAFMLRLDQRIRTFMQQHENLASSTTTTTIHPQTTATTTEPCISDSSFLERIRKTITESSASSSFRTALTTPDTNALTSATPRTHFEDERRSRRSLSSERGSRSRSRSRSPSEDDDHRFAFDPTNIVVKSGGFASGIDLLDCFYNESEYDDDYYSGRSRARARPDFNQKLRADRGSDTNSHNSSQSPYKLTDSSNIVVVVCVYQPLSIHTAPI
eukprot:GEZU01018711.1.p1 GENE.GEZU01018711.1~~GEZU01018711.1.p1  ORF type:complete len:290 (+),score=13.46 GEZU01018711.1:47-916(+)